MAINLGRVDFAEAEAAKQLNQVGLASGDESEDAFGA